MSHDLLTRPLGARVGSQRVGRVPFVVAVVPAVEDASGPDVQEGDLEFVGDEHGVLDGHRVAGVRVVGVSLAVFQVGERSEVKEQIGAKVACVVAVALKIPEVQVPEPVFIDVDVGAAQIGVRGELLVERAAQHSPAARHVDASHNPALPRRSVPYTPAAHPHTRPARSAPASLAGPLHRRAQASAASAATRLFSRNHVCPGDGLAHRALTQQPTQLDVDHYSPRDGDAPR